MSQTLGKRLTDLAETLKLNHKVRRLVWAGLAGDGKLEEALEDPQAEITAPNSPASGNAVGVWLSSITVEGFRGIGERAELVLDPGPGLTLVVGRNGSGKSSFAEGLEALLTGSNQRWRDRPAVWAEGWKNLHHSERVAVSAQFSREGDDQPCVVTRIWGDSFDLSTTEVVLRGARADFDWLGWNEALETYKPFLSYNELGSMLEQKPSEIYDSLAGILGLEQLTEARGRVRNARLEAEKPAKALNPKTDTLRSFLDQTNDARAAQCADLVGARTPDLAALSNLAATDGSEDTSTLRALASLGSPDLERCANAAADLRSAAETVADVSETDSASAAAIADLLDMAVKHVEVHGPGACPVCDTGYLDMDWIADATNKVTQLRRQSAQITIADQQLENARRNALRQILAVPPVLSSPATGGVDVAEALRVWTEWQTIGDDPISVSDLSDRLGEASAVADAVALVKAAAESELKALNDVWRPAATAILSWIADAELAAAATFKAKDLKAAEDLFKKAEEILRQERFAPIADHAAELWAGLRQQSNVSLERVALEGQSTRRRVDLDVTVDGTETSALGVMSQGELHALALALFLPRVTSADSPFRFVLIDDPVQAMDPARVDGLAKMLATVAKDRQVLVFTHDDRLPSACRRLDLNASIYTVDRRAESKVTVQSTERPSLNALKDAESIARSGALPQDLVQRIVPIHCRRAVEAAARDEIWRRLLAGGISHDEIDRRIVGAAMTRELLGVLFACRSSEVQGHLDGLQHGLGAKFGFLNVAVHNPLGVNVDQILRDSRRLVDAIHGMAQ